ncbi:MAG: ABC transporter ATP-binding protein [Patescibacteria group bacterium]|nr:ABC transporter ATP-binding protein [Patescibacteria group bacterium]
MQSGAVVAQGTHQELLKQGGLYQKLWSIQAGGFLTNDGEDSVDKEILLAEDDEEIGDKVGESSMNA